MPDADTEFLGKDGAELLGLFKAACADLAQENFSRIVDRRRPLMRMKVTPYLGIE